MQDLRYALRQLRANPGFTIAAVLTLALGIGANSAIFSVVNAVLLNPLPYRDPGRLLWATGRTPSGYRGAAVSPPDFRDYRDGSRAFEHLAAMFVRGGVPRNWNLNGDTRQLTGAMVTAGFFETLGFAPALGRSFTRADEQTTVEQVIVLSHRAWQSSFNGDASAIGRVVRLDGNPVTIVGVMPPALDFPTGVDFWHPAPMLHPGMQRRFAHFLHVVGRLRPGVSLADAQRDLDDVAARLGAQFPNTNKGWGLYLVPMQDRIVGSVRPVLWILLGAVGLVVLIACVNIANLLLARYGARQRELAIRAAIGASRGRILRQLLTENLLLATLSGAAAIGIAFWGIGLLRAYGPPEPPAPRRGPPRRARRRLHRRCGSPDRAPLRPRPRVPRYHRPPLSQTPTPRRRPGGRRNGALHLSSDRRLAPGAERPPHPPRRSRFPPRWRRLDQADAGEERRRDRRTPARRRPRHPRSLGRRSRQRDAAPSGVQRRPVPDPGASAQAAAAARR